MSHALDIADLIRLRLLAAPAAGEIATPADLSAIDIIVDRQKNVVTAINKAIAKSSGTAITILPLGYQSGEENSRAPNLRQTYTITVYSKPIIAGGNLFASDVMESIINRLWSWVPGGGHVFGRATGFRGGLVPDAKYLVYDLDLSFPVHF